MSAGADHPSDQTAWVNQVVADGRDRLPTEEATLFATLLEEQAAILRAKTFNPVVDPDELDAAQALYRTGLLSRAVARVLRALAHDVHEREAERRLLLDTLEAITRMPPTRAMSTLELAVQTARQRIRTADNQ